jgi:hypothetical protein
MAATGDDHHLLPRHREGPIVIERLNALAVLEAERQALEQGQDVAVHRDPVDAIRLRGIPAVGPGSAGGAILGTRPDRAVLGIDERSRAPAGSRGAAADK